MSGEGRMDEVTAAIVLAAGAGTRAGGPKSRLLLRGVPLPLAHVARLKEAGFRDVVVVARPEDEAWLRASALVIVSTEPDQAGSLARGVAALPADATLVAVSPVDALPAATETLTKLRAAMTDDVRAATPRFQGRAGHPVLVRRDALDVYLSGAPRPLRDVLQDLGETRVLVDVLDVAVTTDLDTAEQIAHATGAPPSFYEPAQRSK